METNGALRVIPGTQNRGVMDEDELQNLEAESTPVTGSVNQGGVVALRPLVTHASSKSPSQIPRRVLPIEYAAVSEFENQLLPSLS